MVITSMFGCHISLHPDHDKKTICDDKYVLRRGRAIDSYYHDMKIYEKGRCG